MNNLYEYIIAYTNGIDAVRFGCLLFIDGEKDSP